MIKSVGWAKLHISPDGHHRGSFYILATHSIYTKQGFGQSTHDHVIHDLVRLAQDQDVFHSLTITALVHPNNDECRRLLTRNRWSQTGEPDIDGVHDEWGLLIAVEDQ